MSLQIVSVQPAAAPLAMTRSDAAAALGMSLTSFEQYVQPHIGLVRKGRLRVVPVAELERWVAENTEAPMRKQVSR